MHYVIELRYDPATEKKLQEACALIGSEFPFKPHVTLTTCESMNFTAAFPALQKIFSRQKPREIQLSYRGIFFSQGLEKLVLYAGVTADQELLKLQEDVYNEAAKHGTFETEFVKPGIMVLHTTLAMDISVDKIEAAMRMLEGRVPTLGRMEYAAVSEDGKEIARFDFEE
jgi:2'-5' RNA ligase